jgi:mono/diheme cytochrome c family protein
LKNASQGIKHLASQDSHDESREGSALFLKRGPDESKANQCVEWNRGVYLVQGLSHCSTCHTPRGFAMQETSLDETGSGFLDGSVLAGWEGYNITSDAKGGIGGWNRQRLVQYCKAAACRVSRARPGRWAKRSSTASRR